MEGHEIKLFEIKDDGKLSLHHEELELILMRPAYKDKEMYIVSVAGAYRKGKSFLLNYFLRYINYKDKSLNSLGPRDKPLEGFSWKGGSQRVTNGINIWSEPQLIKLPTGQTIVVLLMDTEGTQDFQNTLVADVRIFSLSLILSSLQIYSLGGQFGTSDIEYLKLFADSAKALLRNTSNTERMENLVFLIRDWCFPTECPFGFEGGQKMFDQVIKKDHRQDAAVSQNYTFLEQTFQSVRTFLLPHPGSQIGAAEFNGSVGQLNEDFVESLQVLCSEIFNPKSIDVKRIKNKPITCEKFVIWLKQYSWLFHANEPLQEQSVYEAISKATLEENLQDCLQEYDDSMNDVYIDNDNFTDEDTLRQAHLESKTTVMDRFQQTAVLGSAENREKYLNQLDIAMERRFEERLQNFRKNLDFNKRLQMSFYVEQTLQTFQQYAHETVAQFVAENKTSAELASQLDRQSCKFAEDLQVSLLQNSIEIDEETVVKLENTRKRLVEDEVKMFQKFKSATTGTIIMQCLSMYQQKMNQLLKQKKVESSYVQFDQENQRIMDAVVKHFESNVDCNEKHVFDKYRMELDKLLAAKSDEYREQFAWMNEAHAANLNDLLIDECVESYRHYMSGQVYDCYSLAAYNNMHKQCTRTVVETFEHRLIGNPEMKYQCRINLHGRILAYYDKTKSAYFAETNPFISTRAMQAWHEEVFLDGANDKLNKFIQFHTQIVQDVSVRKTSTVCQLL